MAKKDPNRRNEKAIEREDNDSNLEKEKPKGYERNEHGRNNKNSNIKSHIKKQKPVNILGDSMVKKLNAYLLRMK